MRNMTLAEMAQTVLRMWEDKRPDLFVEGAVASQEGRSAVLPSTTVYFDAGACNAGVCVDCDGDCDELAAIEAAAIADWRDDFESQARPGAF